MNYPIEKIATLIGARRIGSAETKVRWLLTDSRSLCFPEETLFFALRSNRNDGHNYVKELYHRGVRNFVVDHPIDLSPSRPVPGDISADPAPSQQANLLVVPNTLEALQRLAERHRDEFHNLPVVGITGSNGKTMVKEWLYQLLLPSQKIVRSPRSYNSQIGVPLSVWLLNEQTQVGIFEAGISQPGEMEALSDIIQPTIGVLTTLGQAHQENFRSMEEKCMEKLILMRHTKAMVYPSDNDIVSRCVRRMDYQGEKIGWSRTNAYAPLYISHEHEGTVNYTFRGCDGSFTIPFIDQASRDNAITCAAIALHLGLTPQQLQQRMAHIEPVAMRLEVKQGQRGCTLINDSYNNDVNSLDIALDFLNRRASDHASSTTIPSGIAASLSLSRPLPGGTSAGTSTAATVPGGFATGVPPKKTLILSDIYQSGLAAPALYAQVSTLLTQRGIDKLIGIGPQISAQADAFAVPEKHFFPSTDAFLASPVPRQLQGELILLKGARSFAFDHITEQLEQRVHETILEVDLGALVSNLNHYRSFLKPQTKLVCMIKADAYGAGAIEVARTLQDHRVDYLAVAVADEGMLLRKAGVTANIMVMNPEMTSFKTLFDYDLEPEVYSFRLLDALIAAARKEGITAWPVHIKLDTGMHRLGFNVEASSQETDEIDQLVDRLLHQQAVIPRSVFSHFVGADSDQFDTFSQQQFECFDKASQRLQAAFSHKILRHIDNSAGIEHFPERQLDMCRLGLGLYGIDPREETTLSCVSTLKTTILQLRHVKAGDSIGYSRRTVLTRDSLIAAIPIGYADGLDRHLGNRGGYCLVNGKKADYVGNICMDVAMVDVTDISCQEGDTVEIFGRNLPVSLLSQKLDTIPYEVLTGVSDRVKRVYFQDQ